MRIVAFITQASVIDRILSYLRTRATTAAHADAQSPPSTRFPSDRAPRNDPPSGRPPRRGGGRRSGRRVPAGPRGVGDRAVRAPDTRPTPIEFPIPRSQFETLLDLGLGYLTLERDAPSLSPGELQRLRLATQIRSNLFGVVYVLDQPSAGLHPADTESLLRALVRLKSAGNSLFVVEHEPDVIRRADWIVNVGPGAGQ